MSATFIYIDNPPQFARFGSALPSGTQSWQVGDRVTKTCTSTYVDYNLKTLTFRCTTAGDGNVSTVTVTTSATGFTAGASVWTAILPDSWDNAATYHSDLVTRGQICYISNELTVFPSYIPPNAVMVDKRTMEPAHPVVYGLSKVFFSAGRFARTPLLSLFGETTSQALTLTHTRDADILAPLGTPSAGSTFGIGVRAKITTTLAASRFLPRTEGEALNIEIIGAAGSSGSSNEIDGFANHLAFSGGSSAPFSALAYLDHHQNEVSIAPYRSVDGVNYQYPCAYAGSGISRDANIYRTSGGAVPVGGALESMYVYGSSGASPLRAGYTDYITMPNSLTGARTLKLYLITQSPVGAAITNSDLFAEVLYPSVAASNQYGFASSMSADFGVVEAAHTPIPIDAVSVWTMLPAYQPTQFVISIPITIGRAGPLRVRLCRAGYSVAIWPLYWCPYMEVV